jgi:hypothetical protein
MDNQLDFPVNIDDSAGALRIDIRGSLSQDSGPGFLAPLYPAQLTAALEAAGVRPLSNYSSDELLAASNFIFELLDDPAGHSGTELLAQYDAICRELDRREVSGATVKHAAGQ